MPPAPRSSPGLRAAYSTLDSAAFCRRTGVGGHRGDSPPVSYIAGLGRRIKGPDARAVPAVAVACPGVGRRCGWERLCAGFYAQTYTW